MSSSLVRKISKRKYTKPIFINKNKVLISLNKSTYSIIRNSSILTTYQLPAKFLQALRHHNDQKSNRCNNGTVKILKGDELVKFEETKKFVLNFYKYF